ncbi:hypothetical protein ES704_01772 [subsurface metagenome]|jgi:glycosyltransferase involved in cell wall biosynthesis
MQNNLLVSVIVISKNCKDIIRRCLDSIFAQTYKNIEVVVIDSSNDETTSVIEEYQKRSPFPFRIIQQEPKGVGAARNAGILNAKGEVVVFVDADCWISENFISEIAKRYAKSDKILCVSTSASIKSSSNSFFSKLVDLYDRVMVASKIPKELRYLIFSPRKKLYEIIGLFDEKLRVGEDAELENKLMKLLPQLKEQGYRFEYVENAVAYEEKQGQTFKEYWKRCIWYGEPLANWRYFRSDLPENTIKLMMITYFTVLPLFLIFLLIAHISTIYIIISIIPFFLLYLYIILKSIAIKEFSWMVFLMPMLLFYKYVGLFIGFVKGVKE